MTTPSPRPRPPRRLLVVSLRVLMFLVLVLAVFFAWETNRARTQAKAVAVLLANGAQIRFDYGYPAYDAKGKKIPNVQSLGPGWMRWLRRNVGDEYFRKPVLIRWDPTVPERVLRKVGARALPESHDDEFLRRMGLLDGLHDVSIQFSTMSDEGIAPLASLVELESFTLWSCRRVTDRGLVYLEALPSLKRLSITRCQTTDAAFASFGKMHALEQLRVEGSITGAGLAQLRPLHRLESLHLISDVLDDSHLASLKELPALKSLTINCFRVTDAGVRSIAAISKLESLTLYWCQVTDEGVEALASLPNLRQLEIHPHEGPLTDRSLEYLRRLVHLESLSLGSSQVKTTEFSDRELDRLVQALPELKLLCLEPAILDREIVNWLDVLRPGLFLQSVR